MTITLVNRSSQATQNGARTQPPAPIPATQDPCGWGIVDYRTVLGWPVEQDADSVLLRRGCGVGAVDFAAGRGRDIVVVLGARNSLGPVLALPGRWLRWVFLTAPDDSGVAGGSTAMVGARLRMTGPDALLLPPSLTAHGPARWIVAPRLGACTLPRLQAVLSAAWQTVAV